MTTVIDVFVAVGENTAKVQVEKDAFLKLDDACGSCTWAAKLAS